MIRKKKRLISLLMIFVLLLAAGCSNGNSKDAAAGEDSKALFKEGTYTAEAEGNGGPVKVEVTFTAT